MGLNPFKSILRARIMVSPACWLQGARGGGEPHLNNAQAQRTKLPQSVSAR
jgi:hypothetical protein